MRTTVISGLRFTQLTACLGYLIVGILSAGLALAQEEVDLKELESEEAPQFVVPPDPTRPYLDAIDRIEEDYGPYATELSDLYLGLGEEFLKEGDYESAKDAYHRGVMTVRVNSGPNSPEQTNLLYLIANIETILEEPKQADKIIENIRFINTNYYGEDSAELLPVYERIFEWYLTSRPLDVDESEYEDYLRMIELTGEMVRVSDVVYGESNPQSALAYRRLGESHFEAMRFALHEEEWLQPRILVSSDVPYQATPGLDDYSMREHYIEGRDAFRKHIELLKADPSASDLDRAEAMADLADWSLHFQKLRSARALYEEAYQLLAQSEEYSDLVDNYLGRPKPMGFTEMSIAPVEGTPLEPDEVSLDVSMTVTRVGDVRYVEILNPPESIGQDQLSEIKKTFQDTPFRPSLKDGKAVTTQGFIWQHIVRPAVQEEIGQEEITS